MAQRSYFSIERVDGCNLGRLTIPLAETADWLNFLLTPQYRADIVTVEQEAEQLEIYFQGSEGLYLYLDMRLNAVELPLAG